MSAADLVEQDDLQPVWKRRPHKAESDLDMAPMIDLTFLLLIFFLVASTPSDPSLVIELPPAANTTSVPVPESVTLSVADQGEKLPAQVYLADGKQGQPLTGDWTTQEAAIRQYVEQAISEGKKYVILKAERRIRHREMLRVARAATSVQGITLHVAVMDQTE